MEKHLLLGEMTEVPVLRTLTSVWPVAVVAAAVVVLLKCMVWFEANTEHGETEMTSVRAARRNWKLSARCMVRIYFWWSTN